MALKYSVWEAKTKLSEILRQVKAGKTVTINQRGVPVAQVVPFKSEEGTSLAQRLDALRNQGLIREGRQPLSAAKLTPKNGALARFLENR
ncbi:MAG: type II toxin-antitoxin system prevent-host-death family antitoxin [Bdellovibrio sp.]|nr:MAG: type II toxin-antitoxin system prevent-host-death family antitoxin [Bdellovibrio sp.]